MLKFPEFECSTEFMEFTLIAFLLLTSRFLEVLAAANEEDNEDDGLDDEPNNNSIFISSPASSTS